MGRASVIVQRVQAIIQGVSGITSTRVKIGYVALSDTDQWYTDLSTTGAYVIISPVEHSGGPSGDSLNKYTVRMSLNFAFNKNANYDFLAIQDLAEDIRNALKNEASFTDCAPSQDCRLTGPNLDTRPTVVYGVYNLEADFLSD